jgi:hypothetical protein
MSRTTRLVPAVVLAFATVALPIATSGPAHATVEACVEHLKSHNYRVTYSHEEACKVGSDGEVEVCFEDLKTLGVWRHVAYDACREASKA